MKGSANFQKNFHENISTTTNFIDQTIKYAQTLTQIPLFRMLN